jgi:mRNA interferase RelE/StbE
LAWKIEFHASAFKELRRLDKTVRRRILTFLKERVASATDPRSVGSALRGLLPRLWKYRVGDYRIICDIQDGRVAVLVVRIRHRSQAYG